MRASSWLQGRKGMPNEEAPNACPQVNGRSVAAVHEMSEEVPGLNGK